MAVPGLHTVGLLLRMSELLDEPRTRTNRTQTAPPDQKLPRIVSRLRTLENESKICRQAFPPGEHFAVPSLPNVTVVNVLGDFSIARDRLAIIDGEGAFVYPLTLEFLTFRRFHSALLCSPCPYLRLTSAYTSTPPPFDSTPFFSVFVYP